MATTLGVVATLRQQRLDALPQQLGLVSTLNPTTLTTEELDLVLTWLCGALLLQKDEKLPAPPRESPEYWKLMDTFLPLSELSSTKHAHQLLSVCVVAFEERSTAIQARPVARKILVFLDQQLSHLTVRVEHRHVLRVVEQVTQVESYHAAPELVQAFELCLSIWQRSTTALNVKKRFELFLQHLFLPICAHNHLTHLLLARTASMLPSFTLSTSSSTEEETLLPPLTASAEGIVGLLRSVLFDASHVCQFYRSFTAWQDRWEKPLEKPARKKKRKRNDLLVSYHRLLLEGLKKGLAQPSSSPSQTTASICAVLPCLLELFTKAMEEQGNSESGSQKPKVSAEGDTTANASKNKAVFAFYYEIAWLLVTTALPLHVRHECFTRITLVLLRSRVYETSNEKMLGALKEMLPGFMKDLTAATSEEKDVVVGSFIALLEVDHRVLEGDMESLVGGLCETFLAEDTPVNTAAGFTYNASVELLLRVIDEYAKLRRMDHIVQLCLSPEVERSQGEDLLLVKALQVGLGKIWRSMPPAQYATQWPTLMERLKRGVTERSCVWFHVFCLAVNVEENNAKDVLKNCDQAFELIERQDAPSALFAPKLLLTTTLQELKKLCLQMDETLSTSPILYEQWEERLQLEEPSNDMDAKARACILLLRNCQEAPADKLCSFVVTRASFALLCANVNLIATRGDASLVAAMVDRMIDDFDLHSPTRVASSPFTRARFYEIQEIHERMGEILSTRLGRLHKGSDHPELKRTMQLIAAIPRNYLTKPDAKRVLSAVVNVVGDRTREEACAVLFELGHAYNGLLSSTIKQKKLRTLVIPQHKYSESLVKLFSKDLLQQDRSAAKFVRNAKAIIEADLVDLAVACLEPVIAYLHSSSDPLHSSIQRLWNSLWLRLSPVGKTGGDKMNFQLYSMLLRIVITAKERVDTQLYSAVIDALPGYTSKATAEILSTNSGAKHDQLDLDLAASTYLIATAALVLPQLSTDRSSVMFKAITDVILKLLKQTITLAPEHPQALSNLVDAVQHMFQGCAVGEQTDALLCAVEAELRCDGPGEVETERVAAGLRACKIAFEALAHGEQKRQAATAHAKVLVTLIVDAAVGDTQGALEVLAVACKRFPEWFRSKRNEDSLVYVVIGLVGILTQRDADKRRHGMKESLSLLLHVFTTCLRLNSAVLIKMAVAVAQASQHVVRSIVANEVQCTAEFERFSQELATHGKAFKHYAVHWLVAYVDTCRRSNIPPGLRSALDAAAFHWIDMCQEHELQQIHAMLRATNRLIFKDLHDSYDRVHKYRGTV